MPVIYSKKNCYPCNLVKNFLRGRGIQYEVRDVEDNPSYMQDVMDMGFMSVPVTIINGQPISGPNLSAIVDKLNIPSLT